MHTVAPHDRIMESMVIGCICTVCFMRQQRHGPTFLSPCVREPNTVDFILSHRNITAQLWCYKTCAHTSNGNGG